MNIYLSNASGKALYEQIYDRIRTMILDGTLKAGQPLPTIRGLAKDLRISVITTSRAYADLERDGYIYSVVGKGSFVSSQKTDMQLNHLSGFSDEMRAMGMTPSTLLADKALVLPSESVAKALRIEPDQKIYLLVRVRCADGVPMAVEKVHIPFYRFAGLEEHDLSQSLYGLLKEEYGCESYKATQSIRAGAASTFDAKLLKIPTGTPVLCIARTTYSSDGVPFEYVDSVYRGDKYVFNVTLEK